jgi:hypothetical protein
MVEYIIISLHFYRLCDGDKGCHPFVKKVWADTPSCIDNLLFVMQNVILNLSWQQPGIILLLIMNKFTECMLASLCLVEFLQ